MTVENKRLGRETELRRKMKEALQRYRDVFGKPMTTEVLKEFLDESEKHNRMTFLVDRIGVLSDADIGFLRNVLRENVAEKEPVTEDNSLEDIDEIDSVDELSA